MYVKNTQPMVPAAANFLQVRPEATSNASFRRVRAPEMLSIYLFPVCDNHSGKCRGGSSTEDQMGTGVAISLIAC